MAQIEPIETVYNGYKFRSRHEVRWAVFFDALNIEYQYEPDAYRLPSGGYLPDFYLPEFELYVEIKPFDRSVISHVGDGNQWEKRCEEFHDVTGMAILLCYGTPSDDIWKVLFADESDSGGGGYCECPAMFRWYNNKPYLVALYSRDDATIFVKDWEPNERVITKYDFFDMHIDEIRERFFCELNSGDVFDPIAADPMNVAKRIARQARFDHGETPKPEQVREAFLDLMLHG